MESQSNLLQLNHDTKQYLQKQYNLENPARLNESIDILEEWLNKQGYTAKKNMSKDHLERLIILNKGSIEKVKTRLDMLFTYRTLKPIYFELFDVDELRKDHIIIDALLPKLTPDHYRVYLHKYSGDDYNVNFMNFYRFFTATCEYIHTHDYCSGIVVVLDYMDTNVLNVMKALNLNDIQQVIKIIVEAFGLRLKGIHVVTPSSCVNIVLSFIKQASSAKIGQRIFGHKNFDTVYDTISKDILPIEYGGKEKSLKELHVDLLNTLSSTQFTNYLKEILGTCSNQVLRQKHKLDNELMGIPGTFRSLCLD